MGNAEDAPDYSPVIPYATRADALEAAGLTEDDLFITNGATISHDGTRKPMKTRKLQKRKDLL